MRELLSINRASGLRGADRFLWLGLLEMAEVEIYTNFLCGYCYRAKKLLESKGVSFTEFDVMLRPGKRAEMIERSGGRTSVPQVFVDGRHLGNCDEIYALEAEGRLDTLLGLSAG
jgi:glutaredoxin 3